MNMHWKKGFVTAALSLVILAQGATAHAQGVYKVQDNDTFWKLSVQFGVSIEQLMQVNPGVEANNIYKGMKLVIPDPVTSSDITPDAKLQAKQAPTKAVKLETTAADKKVVAKQATKTADKEAPKQNDDRKTDSAKLVIGDKAYAYTEVVKAKASAYTAASSENGSWGAVDYFGNPLKLGTIAVDPDVIPMGSKVYITGYNFNGLPSGGMMAVASDQGGAINGNRIDIFVPQSKKSASNFGYQYVKVYILD